MSDGIPSRSTRHRRWGECAALVAIISTLSLFAHSTRQPMPNQDDLRRQAQAAQWMDQIRQTGHALVTTVPATIAENQRAGHPYVIYRELKEISQKLAELQAEMDALRAELEQTPGDSERTDQLEQRMLKVENELDGTLKDLETL